MQPAFANIKARCAKTGEQLDLDSIPESCPLPDLKATRELLDDHVFHREDPALCLQLLDEAVGLLEGKQKT